MSFMGVTPDVVTSAAANLDTIGSGLNEANAAAANGTTGMAAMAADDVSAAVQSAFVNYGQNFQAVSAQAAAFHAALVRRLGSSALAYLGAEMANARQAMGADIAIAAKTVGGDVATAARALRADVAIARQDMRAEAVAVGRSMRAEVAVAKQDLVNALNAPARALLGQSQTGSGQPNGGTGTTSSSSSPSSTGSSSSPSSGGTGSSGGNNTATDGAGGGVTRQPITTQPITTQPVTTQPVTTQPVTTQPITTQPVAAQPITTQPATTDGASAANATAVATTDSGTAVATGTVSPTASAPATGSVTATDGSTTVSVSPTASAPATATATDGNGTVTVSSGGSATATGSTTGTDTGSTTGTVTGTTTGTVTGTSTGTATASGGGNSMGTAPVTEVDVKTPLGPVELTLSQGDLANGTIGWTGSVQLPRSLVLGVDALGAPAGAMNALHSSITTFDTAVQTGHPVAAIDALVHAPENVMNGFLYGQTSITAQLPAIPGYDGSVTASIPLGGVLAPVRPLTVTLTPSTGTPTVVTLTGSEFGGIATALK